MTENRLPAAAQAPVDAPPLPGLSPAGTAALSMMKLRQRAERLEAASDSAANSAMCDYFAARKAAEDAGLLMRRIELADLRDRHASILPPDARVDVGVGWRELVDDALDRLAGMHVVVSLIREKFGGLDMKVYPRSRWRAEDFDAVEPAKAPAVEAALRTCEACAAPGSLRRLGRAVTRCDAHVDL